jgi:transposase
MAEYFGGSTALWVPDQLRSAVSRPCRYEPGINRSYQELARHYGAVVLPARPGKARDKATVESMVLVSQRWILARLRNRTFFSLPEINAVIGELLEHLNGRPMQKIGKSRRELWEKLDRPALKPLPVGRHEVGEWTSCRVNIDYHVEVARHPYSVPYQLLGEELEARFTSTVVEIYHNGHRLVSYRRRYDGQPTTLAEHMPSAHRAHAEWSPSRLIHWAEKTGPATGRLVAGILESRPHPEQGYRACLGLMRLGRRYGAVRLEAACERAEHLRSYSYLTVKNILASSQDRVPLEADGTAKEATCAHDNIRGGIYYAGKKEHEC